MLNNFQQLFLDNSCVNGLFLDLMIYNSSDSILVSNALELVHNSKAALLFLLVDFYMYYGIIALVYYLGKNYRLLSSETLGPNLFRLCSRYSYVGIILNLFGLYYWSAPNFIYNLSLFENSYTFNLFTQVTKLILFVVVGALYNLSNRQLNSLELPVLMHIIITLSCSLISCTNFVLLLLSLEGFSLILYIMTTLSRVYGGVIAAVKYFSFGTLGSIFLFWGVAHLYSLTPLLTYGAINNAVIWYNANNFLISGYTINFATSLISIGFMLKLGAAPTHQWVADVYAGSALCVTAFFSIYVKFVLFAIFWNLIFSLGVDQLLKIFALLSLGVGCVMSVRQTQVKRLLAYSSIVHVAFLLMGDSLSSLVYLLTYTAGSLLLFSVLLTIENGGKELIYLNDMRFVSHSGQTQIFYTTVALASTAGLPPFGGFYGKILVWSSLIEDVYLFNNNWAYSLLLFSLIISLITIYYYMRLIAYLFVGINGDGFRSRLTLYKKSFAENNIRTFVQLILCILVVLWTFLQTWILDWLHFIIVVKI